MANKKILLMIGLNISLAHGALNITKWADLPATGINTDTIGNWTYDQTQANDFVLKNQIFFASSTARLYINATISGNWNNACGMIFCLDTQKSVVFNPGHILLALDSDQVAQSSGLFQLQNKASLEINSNLSITATSMSNFEQGLFNVKDAALHFINSDLSLDLSNNQKKITLFDLSQTANVTLNSSGNSAQQKVLLKGGIKLADQAKFELNLSNRESNFEGFIELKGTSNFTLNLTRSQSTLTGYDEQLNGTGQANFNLKQSVLYAQLKGRQTDLNLSSSVWNMFDNNEVRNLTLQNSQIDFIQNAQGSRLNQAFMQKTLQANSLKGSGIFKLYADLDQKQVDAITLQNAQGHHQVQILYNPKTFTQALAQAINERSNMVVTTIVNANQAIFEGGKSEIGLIVYQTNLKKITQNAQTQWVISSIVPSGYSTLSRVLSTALNTPYRLFDLANSILTLRLGDLRNYPKDYGLYFRIMTGLNQLKETPNTLAIQESWVQFAAGFDFNNNYFQRTDFFGIGLDATLLHLKHPIFALQSQGYGFNFYYTSIFDHRFYFDLIFKYSFSPSSFQPSQNLNFQTHLIHLGLEIGKKIAMQNHKNFFYIEPQSKITSGAILPLAFEINDPEKIKGELQTQIPLIARVSLYLGHEWNTDLIGDFKIGSFVEYSLKNGGKILLSDPRSSIEQEFKSDFDVGITAIGSIEVQKVWRFYFGLDSSFLGNYTTDITFNAGIRWSFGNRYIPSPPLIKKSETPDRLKIRYRFTAPSERTIPIIQREEIEQMKHYDRRIVKTQRDRNKNRFLQKTSIENPLTKTQGQREYNRNIKRDSTLFEKR